MSTPAATRRSFFSSLALFFNFKPKTETIHAYAFGECRNFDTVADAERWIIEKSRALPVFKANHMRVLPPPYYPGRVYSVED